METNDCDQGQHDWKVLRKIDTVDWEEWMKYREGKDEPLTTSYPITHTLFCPKCKSIKQVNH